MFWSIYSVLASQNPKAENIPLSSSLHQESTKKSSHFSTAHFWKTPPQCATYSYTWKHERQTSRESSLSMSHYSWPSVCEWTMGIKRKTILLLQLGSGSGKPTTALFTRRLQFTSWQTFHIQLATNCKVLRRLSKQNHENQTHSTIKYQLLSKNHQAKATYT